MRLHAASCSFHILSQLQPDGELDGGYLEHTTDSVLQLADVLQGTMCRSYDNMILLS